jgi:hypothetical protein
MNPGQPSANLPRSDLRGADLRGCTIDDVHLRGARYDKQTRWPDGFDPVAAGAAFIPWRDEDPMGVMTGGDKP